VRAAPALLPTLFPSPTGSRLSPSSSHGAIHVMAQTGRSNVRYVDPQRRYTLVLGPSWNAPIGALPHDDRAGTHDSADGQCGSYASTGHGQAATNIFRRYPQRVCQGLLRCGISSRLLTAVGLVSRVSPVQTALRNCTRDEGRSFEFGNQVLISSHRKLLSSKAMVVNVAETLGHDLSRHGRERRAQANRCRSVESGLGDVKTGGSPALRDQLGGCPDSDRAASGVQAARSSTRLLCGT